MKLKLLSAAVVAPLAMFMMLEAGPAQAADSCSFSERGSVFGSDCRGPDNVRGADRNFNKFNGPGKKVVEIEEEEPAWDRDRKRGKGGKGGKGGNGGNTPA